MTLVLYLHTLTPTLSLAVGCEVFHNLKKVIKSKFGGDATLSKSHIKRLMLTLASPLILCDSPLYTKNSLYDTPSR
jgi:hypothetical protein